MCWCSQIETALRRTGFVIAPLCCVLLCFAPLAIHIIFLDGVRCDIFYDAH